MADAKEPAGGEAEAVDGRVDRRSNARLPVEMWVEDLTDGGVVHRRAGNLSLGGLYLDRTIPLPVGTTVRLRFTLPGGDQPIAVTGEIVSVAAEEALGMGVKFTEIERDAELRLAAYVESLGTPAAG